MWWLQYVFFVPPSLSKTHKKAKGSFLNFLNSTEKQKNAHNRTVCRAGHARRKMNMRWYLPPGKEFSFVICAKPVWKTCLGFFIVRGTPFLENSQFVQLTNNILLEKLAFVNSFFVFHLLPYQFYLLSIISRPYFHYSLSTNPAFYATIVQSSFEDRRTIQWPE